MKIQKVNYKTLILSVLFLFFLAACSSTNSNSTNSTNSSATDSGNGGNTQQEQGGNDEKAKEKQTVSIGTSSAGSLYNILTVGFADIVSKNTSISASAITTGGADATLRAIGDGKTDMGMVHTWALRRAYAGEEPFEQKVDVRQVLQGQETGVYLIARADAGIETPADLKGKRLIGKRPALKSIDEFTATVLDVYGLTEDDVKVMQTSETNETVQALEQGTVDAVVLPGGIATPQVAQLAQTTDVVFVKITDDKMQEIMNHPNVTNGAFISVNPAGTYKGQDEDYPFLTYSTVLAGASSLSDELVYEIVKGLDENKDQLSAVHASGGAWVAENSIKNTNFSVPFHPGAIKYFEEKGIWTDELQKRQDELLK
ncbi:TAXI family TRAP transporter solute-binding subunit [Bacillus sp. Marseille-P3661]|uniref:TAXI family TRAP transporter solute-binding subunit n=1 Tax=Bacillus sp. Marseille-P3661 TaxID=1936234 RepID=UPI000C853D1E|nr:TAXI family TRAP transporter solute-binding subunit [Bacillus sp. Marseille-P3661]